MLVLTFVIGLATLMTFPSEPKMEHRKNFGLRWDMSSLFFDIRLFRGSVITAKRAMSEFVETTH